jgi:Tfp pilus assembly protein PilF
LPDFSPAELVAAAQEAQSLLSEAVDADPEWSDPLVLRARVREMLRADEAALRDLDAALGLSPGGALLLERGRLRLLRSIRLTRAPLLPASLPTRGLREPDEARALRRDAAQDLDRARPQTTDESSRLAGLRALAHERLEEAETEFAALPARDADGRWFLAIVQARRGKLAEADASLAEAIKARPHFAEAHLLQALLRIRLDRLDDAAAAVALAGRIAPGLGDVALVEGALLLARGNAARAADAYDRAVRLDARDSIALLCRAWALASSDPEAARRAVDLAVQLQSEALELALALRSRLVADSATAEMDAERATKENPDFAGGWHALADARLRRGNPVGAAEARRTAEELDKR